MPDNVFFVLQEFHDRTKPWLQNVQDEMEMVCMFIKYCLNCYATENKK